MFDFGFEDGILFKSFFSLRKPKGRHSTKHFKFEMEIPTSEIKLNPKSNIRNLK